MKQAAPVPGNGQHIMYIDDEQSLCSAIKRVLDLLGYRCTCYTSVQSALEAFRNSPDEFDAVISDMTMPLLSGFDVAKELQAIRPNVPIALTSGRATQGTDTHAFSLGIKAWIPKPATIDELSHAVETLLRSGSR
jgi:DNA-binding response OmpR family regulator